MLAAANGIKQIWLRYGTVNSNDFHTFVRTHTSANVWGNWVRYATLPTAPGTQNYVLRGDGTWGVNSGAVINIVQLSLATSKSSAKTYTTSVFAGAAHFQIVMQIMNNIDDGSGNTRIPGSKTYVSPLLSCSNGTKFAFQPFETYWDLHTNNSSEAGGGNCISIDFEVSSGTLKISGGSAGLIGQTTTGYGIYTSASKGCTIHVYFYG